MPYNVNAVAFAGVMIPNCPGKVIREVLDVGVGGVGERVSAFSCASFGNCSVSTSTPMGGVYVVPRFSVMIDVVIMILVTFLVAPGRKVRRVV